MGALTNHRYKREPDPSSLFNHDHPAKKLKSFDWDSKPKPKLSSNNSASRLHLYPKKLTPFVVQIQAPIPVLRGFNSSSKGLDSRKKSDFSCFSGILGGAGDKMGALFSRYNRGKKEAKGSCRYVTFDEKDEVVEVTDLNGDVNYENDGSGDSGVEEIVMMECDKGDGTDDVEKSGELQSIRDKYRELDGKVERNGGVQASVLDGKALESLSLNRKVDTKLVYQKLRSESAKRDARLGRLSFDIKFQEEKRALFKELTPVKKDEEADKDEEILLEAFRPLTEDDDEMVANALSNSSRRKVLVTHENSNITITGEVLRCLLPGAWLNDEVINVYLELLKERERKNPDRFLKCHFFNTFFYKKLIGGRTGYDYKSVKRWTSQKKLGYSLLDCDKIFVPVHKQIHWCLAVINKKEEKFQYLDSLGGIDKQVMRELPRYYVDEVKDKNGVDIDVSSWQQEYVTELPNQENGFDCGVFMIKYADFYSRGIGLCFDQEHMPYFRLRTAKEVLTLRAD